MILFVMCVCFYQELKLSQKFLKISVKYPSLMCCCSVLFHKYRAKFFVSERHTQKHLQGQPHKPKTDRHTETRADREINRYMDNFTRQPTGNNRFKLMQQTDVEQKTQGT